MKIRQTPAVLLAIFQLLLVSLVAAPSLVSAGAPRCELAWGPAGVFMTVTGSVKWRIRLVEDGAGGVVLAWEENRNRGLCCRDTRDLYAQRLDAGGLRLWGEFDRQVAAQDEGEELIGLLPEHDHGALVLWRRDDTLLIQQLDASGRKVRRAAGAFTYEASAKSGWNAQGGFARSPSGEHGILVWTELAPVGRVSPELERSAQFGARPKPRRSLWFGAGVYALSFVRHQGRWAYGQPVQVVPGHRLHGATVTACGDAGWLVCYWSRSRQGAELRGRWLTSQGVPRGEAFRIGGDDRSKYLHVELAAFGPKAAFVLWAAVDTDSLKRTHQLQIAHLQRDRSGKTRVRAAGAGTGRTMAVYMPSLVVQMDGQEERPATPALMTWRRTAALAAIGPGAALVSWVEGSRLNVRRFSVSPGGLNAGELLGVADPVDPGFPPMWLAAGAGRKLLVWADKKADNSPVRMRWMKTSGQRLALASEPATVAEDPEDAPRLAAIAVLNSREVVLAWSTMRPPGSALIKVQKLILHPASP